MTDKLVQRIEQLEIRLMHLEAALDEVTRTLLQQEQLTARQAELIRQLESQLKGLSATVTGPQAEQEPPPPHY
ncbi:MAG: SlyX family protein [Gammaproteobacteria bacterium]|nr:SlyX family protein [Gammaproteobacteria bacterium]